jgi:pimeloyl-ACP methyl ester carboxylesterase
VQREVRYAVNDGVHIAYTVVGDGPVDVVYAPGIWSNLDVMWEEPRWARFLDRLASFARLIVFDMRSVGLSDRGSGPPFLESQMDDISAVMQAARSESAVIFGGARGGAMSMLFAATYPDRVRALVLYAAVAKTVQSADFPHGKSEHDQQAFFDRFVAEMGTGRNLDLQGPDGLDDPRFVRWWARFERLVATPSAYRELALIFNDLDVRAVLPAIQAPTLVVQRVGDRITPVSQARFLAATIPGARLVELPGEDHIPFLGDADALVDEIEEFVTGSRPAPGSDSFLSTVLFTDIVGSTERQAAMGDRAWRDVVLAHHERGAVSRTTRPATASSRRSTGRHVLSAVPWRCPTGSATWGSRSALVSTRASARPWTASVAGSLWRSVPGSRASPGLRRSLSPRPSRTS